MVSSIIIKDWTCLPLLKTMHEQSHQEEQLSRLGPVAFTFKLFLSVLQVQLTALI